MSHIGDTLRELRQRADMPLRELLVLSVTRCESWSRFFVRSFFRTPPPLWYMDPNIGAYGPDSLVRR